MKSDFELWRSRLIYF